MTALENAIKKMKRPATEWGKYLQFVCLAKESYPEYLRRQITIKWGKRLRQTLPKTHKWPISTGNEAPRHYLPGKCKLKPRNATTQGMAEMKDQ